MQNQHSRLMFKKQIRSNIYIPPPYFALGTRTYNIFHCQLRNSTQTWQVTWTNTSSCHTCQIVQGVLVGMMLKTTFTTFTAGNSHKQNSRFCKEIREDNFRCWWGRVHEDASQGMYMSKIEICYFTARILQNQKMLCCGESFHN